MTLRVESVRSVLAARKNCRRRPTRLFPAAPYNKFTSFA